MNENLQKLINDNRYEKTTNLRLKKYLYALGFNYISCYDDFNHEYFFFEKEEIQEALAFYKKIRHARDN